VFRFKDITSWWLSQHYNRPAGVESATPTTWVPQGKPIWFTELGCPAVDKGANEPNVFIDPKSSESLLPVYSQGTRDDLIQRCFLQAFLTGLDPSIPATSRRQPGVISLFRPHGRSRPRPRLRLGCAALPGLPANSDTWGDAGNCASGTGSTAPRQRPLAATVSANPERLRLRGARCRPAHGAAPPARHRPRALRPRGPRPAQLAFFIDARESAGRIRLRQRGSEVRRRELTPDLLVERRPGDALATLTRAQETDLPACAKLAFISAAGDYPPAVEEARRLAGRSGRTAVPTCRWCWSRAGRPHGRDLAF